MVLVLIKRPDLWISSCVGTKPTSISNRKSHSPRVGNITENCLGLDEVPRLSQTGPSLKFQNVLTEFLLVHPGPVLHHMSVRSFHNPLGFSQFGPLLGVSGLNGVLFWVLRYSFLPSLSGPEVPSSDLYLIYMILLLPHIQYVLNSYISLFGEKEPCEEGHVASLSGFPSPDLFKRPSSKFIQRDSPS